LLLHLLLLAQLCAVARTLLLRTGWERYWMHAARVVRLSRSTAVHGVCRARARSVTRDDQTQAAVVCVGDARFMITAVAGVLVLWW
jgi:hypothetical protein